MLLQPSPLDARARDAEANTSFWRIATDIAEAHGTPFYIYFPDRAESAYRALASGSAAWGRVRVAYSVKTNPLFALLQQLERCGAYAEVVSSWEFFQVMAAGFLPEQIIFNGPLKPGADLRAVLQTAGPLTVNVDSLDELSALENIIEGTDTVVRVGLRVCPPQNNGAWSRFGLELGTGELRQAVGRCISNRCIRLRFIHFHVGTQTNERDRYIEVVEIAKRLWNEHQFGDDVCLDIGGGFPYDHSVAAEAQPFDAKKLFGALADTWGSGARPPLCIEPGRIIAAPTMAVVSRVLARKPRTDEPTIVVLDSGTNHNVMAAYYEHLWSYDGTGAATAYRFCGPLCMEDDILSGRRFGPLPAVGALVATLNAGAYSLSLARTFIQPRPPIFQVNRDGTYQQLERRETYERAYGFGPSGFLAGERSWA